jgi:ABC-type amino acid transport substrate-binding protein
VTAAGWIPDLVNGNVDLIAATVSRSPEREKLVDFSTVFFTTTQRIIAKRATIASLKDLQGKRIGTALKIFRKWLAGPVAEDTMMARTRCPSIRAMRRWT